MEMRSRSNNRHRRLTRAEAERLLSGMSVDIDGLGRLPAAMEALRRAGVSAPTEAEAQSVAARAARLVEATSGQYVSRGSSARGTVAARKRRSRLAYAGATAAVVVLLSGFGGLAYAANGAVPGDDLYGVDLALEKVGLGAGGLEERLNEASQMAGRGRVEEGLRHAGDSIAASAPGDLNLQTAAAALRAAAAGAANSQGLQSAEGRALVAERLRQMASSAPTGEAFGQAAQELLGSLGQAGQPGGDSEQGEGPSTDGHAPGSGSGQGGSTSSTEPGGNGGGKGGGGGSFR